MGLLFFLHFQGPSLTLGLKRVIGSALLGVLVLAGEPGIPAFAAVGYETPGFKVLGAGIKTDFTTSSGGK